MHSTQQRFWPDAQPLVDRFGRDFFRSVPTSPGIYLMRDRAETVLYVGKAKSLRHRLGSYRVANPERMARRTLRLLALVNDIRWEECEDERAALRRESELLLSLKPRFNRAGVWKGPRRCLLWRVNCAGVEIAINDQIEADWNCLGIFGAQARVLRDAIVRLLWCRLRPAKGLVGMPANWFSGETGTQLVIPCSGEDERNELSFLLDALEQREFDSFQQALHPPAHLFEERSRAEDLGYLQEKLQPLGPDRI